ncbi:Nuclear envelope pore membrane protein POM 121 [Manis javanica]|nr:Nuclear envelope pore membrane protein POM 121 [Manis javanica]
MHRPYVWHHNSSGSGHSAFKPEVTNEVRTPFVPKPGPLKSGRNVQSSDGRLNKRFHPYTRGIPMSGRSHNAIPSDHSSTGGISQVHSPGGVEEVDSLHLLVDYAVFTSLLSDAEITSKRLGPPEESDPQASEESSHNSGSSAPLGTDNESQGEQDTTTCRKQNSWDSPSTPSSSRPRRQKVQLVPSRQGILLILVVEDKTETALNSDIANPPAMPLHLLLSPCLLLGLLLPQPPPQP